MGSEEDGDGMKRRLQSLKSLNVAILLEHENAGSGSNRLFTVQLLQSLFVFISTVVGGAFIPDVRNPW